MTPVATPCFHCGEPIPRGLAIHARVSGRDEPVCCHGCKAVAEFIDSSGLARYYGYRDRPDAELRLKPAESDWRRFDSEDLLNRYVHVDQGRSEAVVDVGGMYCSACVWLFDNALSKQDGIEAVDVNPATRRAVIRWDGTVLRFSELLDAIARVGFKPSPVAVGEAGGKADDEYRQALKRLIVAAAAGMQVMMFAVALYAGDYFGIEGEVAVPIFDNGDFGLIADVSGSYIDADLGDGTNVPRIPPLSLLGALELQSNAFDVRGEVQWFAEQDAVAAFETPTDAFTLVNALVSWRPLPGNQNVTLQLAADNLFDVTGRRHASFTKDFVPLAGRNIRASVRLSF